MKKSCKKIFNNTKLVQNPFVTNPFATRKAIDLFEKQSDIKKFAKLVTKDEITDEFLDNTQAELMLKDIFNPFDDESYKKLAENERLLEDLTSDTNEG